MIADNHLPTVDAWLREARLHVKVLAHHMAAHGCPLPPELDSIDHLLLISALRTSEAAEGYDKLREKIEAGRITHAKALENAETRVRAALAGMVEISICEAGFDPRGYFVYVLWGRDERRPLYVGQSTNILARLGDHLGDRKKRYGVTRVSVFRCKSEGQMDKHEARLIAEFQPPWNTQGIRAVPRSAA